MLKDLKPSTRQRFVALEFGFPPAGARDGNRRARRAAWTDATAIALVTLAGGSGNSATAGWPRCRARASSSRRRGSSPAAFPMRTACASALLGPLTDDPDLLASMHDLVRATM